MQNIIKKHNPKIVAVAGSVGKTTTKIAIANVLSQGFRVQFQDGNYNTPISIPFIFTGQVMPSLYNPFSWAKAWLKGRQVLKKEYPYDIVVIELAIDTPGDMEVFKNLIHPDISVMTAVCEEHMEFFKTLDAVAEEELLLADFSDIFVFNQEDVDKKFLDKYIPTSTATKSYGLNSGQYKVIPKQTPNRFYIDAETSRGKIKNIEVNNLVATSLKSISAAIAVADILNMKSSDIIKGIAKIKPVAGRMQILDGIKGLLIIDDTYNSSPLAVEAALDSLYEIKGKPGMQRIAILGSMNELGDYSKDAHERVGSYCDPKKLDLLVTIGGQANKYLASAAAKKGVKVLTCNSPYEAAKIVKRELQDDAALLAKGSQNGVFAEESVKMLLADPSDASKLVRQNSFWQAKKRAQFKDAS
jgi:UDP-N-acetylmuramoyl-tripeptide--D-alanyl-D-alanine ligase